MNDSLDAAIISPAQIIEMSHPLAAANHRQWIAWERWVLRDPARLTPEGVNSIVWQARASGLDDMLALHARMVIDIVKLHVGEFAYSPTVASLVQRKFDQFNGWVAYVVKKTPEDRTRWLLQCRTPFLSLSPEMQASDYTEAEKDLMAIAEAGGLVLTDPFPALVPQTTEQLERLRQRHKLGMHGKYVGSEQPWSNICVGCHRDWSVSH
ncbi:MAG TPA: hypothetical protein VFH06_03565 [Candidatus Saccharimonadales bacterium]|nr:hypothetical protein [Candidatus Saccharimonadales bacterium]